MSWYVRIKRLNGRHDIVRLAAEFEPKGFDDRVEYNAGGWADQMVHNVASHLKFENEDDAIAYILAYGGEVSRTLPEEHLQNSVNT